MGRLSRRRYGDASSPVSESDRLLMIFLPLQNILLHTLKENGVESPQQLDQFVTHDVQRHGAKLHDLRRKLDYAYKDLVRVSLQTWEE